MANEECILEVIDIIRCINCIIHSTAKTVQDIIAIYPVALKADEFLLCGKNVV
jgi:hypothetical protein